MHHDNFQETLVATNFGEQYLYSVNGDSFLQQHSSDIYRRHISADFFETESYHIVIGTDSGLLIQYLIEHGIPEKSCYLFIELEQYLPLIKPDLPLELEQKLKFCTPQEFLNGYDEQYRESYLYVERFKTHRSIAVTEVNNTAYNNARMDVEALCDKLKLDNKLGFGCRDFIIKQLNNSSYNVISSHRLHKRFSGQTAIILAGGPSLDLDLEWVKENQDRLTVIAVARLSTKLQSEGIKPDIVVSVDPSQASYNNSKELLDFDSSTLLVNGNHINSQLLSQWRHKSIYVGNLLPWETSLNDDCSFAGGPTVSNIALLLAVNMGFAQILLSGVDLCFDSTGKSHTSGSVEADNSAYISLQGQWVKTYKGDWAETTNNFSIAIETIAGQAKYALDNNVQVYNLSFTAAQVENISYRDKQDIVFPCSKMDVLAELPKLTTNLQRQYLNTLKREFERVDSDLNTIKKLSRQAIEANIVLSSSAQTDKKRMQASKKIQQVEDKLSKKYGYLAPLIKKVAISEFVKMLALEGVEQASSDEVTELTNQYYQSFITGSELLHELLEPAVTRLNWRMNALGNNPNIDGLIEYWNKNQEFGALSTWVSNNLEGKEEGDRLQELVEREELKKYQYHVAIDEISRRDMFQESELLTKIRTVFTDGHVQGIEQIIIQLELMKVQSENHASLLALAKAYLSVLVGEKKAAIESFDLVSSEILSEIEYKLAASLLIDMERYEEAEMVLSTLSHLLMVHLPLFAKILSINGKIEQAVDAYAQFLEAFPNHVNVWYDLATLYLSINNHEAAKMALDFILQLEPNHESASLLISEINNV
ncbi:6-hydroxymethylpterin diphosphokinase MptE-like protein [Psychrobium sp. nBUS_13]|uniref:6-hydroxymethylpterin diphosphokinase MptE-like protein n=1 Tax=Psychrobium sp. nBUS_13 TaxID=3395319 RepID=UPI003EBCDBBF